METSVFIADPVLVQALETTATEVPAVPEAREVWSSLPNGDSISNWGNLYCSVCAKTLYGLAHYHDHLNGIALEKLEAAGTRARLDRFRALKDHLNVGRNCVAKSEGTIPSERLVYATAGGVYGPFVLSVGIGASCVLIEQSCVVCTQL